MTAECPLLALSLRWQLQLPLQAVQACSHQAGNDLGKPGDLEWKKGEITAIETYYLYIYIYSYIYVNIHIYICKNGYSYNIYIYM